MTSHIYANDKLYTISLHAEEEMEADNITLDEVEIVRDDADSMTLSRSSGANVYTKRLLKRTVTVVVDDERNVVITAFLLSTSE